MRLSVPIIMYSVSENCQKQRQVRRNAPVSYFIIVELYIVETLIRYICTIHSIRLVGVAS